MLATCFYASHPPPLPVTADPPAAPTPSAKQPMSACLAVANDASSALNLDAFYAMQPITGYPGQIGDYDQCAKVRGREKQKENAAGKGGRSRSSGRVSLITVATAAAHIPARLASPHIHCGVEDGGLAVEFTAVAPDEKPQPWFLASPRRTDRQPSIKVLASFYDGRMIAEFSFSQLPARVQWRWCGRRAVCGIWWEWGTHLELPSPIRRCLRNRVSQSFLVTPQSGGRVRVVYLRKNGLVLVHQDTFCCTCKMTHFVFRSRGGPVAFFVPSYQVFS